MSRVKSEKGKDQETETPFPLLSAGSLRNVRHNMTEKILTGTVRTNTSTLEARFKGDWVKSGHFGHQVISDIHLQTVEIQMRRLLMSRLIRIFTVCFYSNSQNMKQTRSLSELSRPSEFTRLYPWSDPITCHSSVQALIDMHDDDASSLCNDVENEAWFGNFKFK